MAIQLNDTAFIPKSLPIEGRAMLTEEPIKGVRKEVKVATSKAAFLVAALFIIIPFIINNSKKTYKDFI
jgi:hypothetical protein